MSQKYTLKNKETGEVIRMNFRNILREINRDRSDDFQKYNRSDWREGLEAFTEWTLIKPISAKLKKQLIRTLQFERRCLRNMLRVRHPNEYSLEDQQRRIRDAKAECDAVGLSYRESKYE